VGEDDGAYARQGPNCWACACSASGWRITGLHRTRLGTANWLVEGPAKEDEALADLW